MNIHEYQAKQVFRAYGLPTAPGGVAHTAAEAVETARELGGMAWAVKAQAHAGGRGKAGGVKLAKSLEEVALHAGNILGMTMVTHQTGAAGKLIRKVYIESAASIQKEFYLGITLDRALETPVMIASTEGGVEIEKVAAESPEKILRVAIDPMVGYSDYIGRNIGFDLGLPATSIKAFCDLCRALVTIYQDKDASLIEINPLILTADQTFLALDGKMVFDDNALDRQPDITAMRDLDEEEPSEVEASRFDLNYVKMNGSVGCMVNGAGLAMATMDIIKHCGGEPANFLDVGGGAKPETVAKGFEIILSDPNVKAVFVNIFGGIVRCDRVANGILEATKLTRVDVPVIVRLDGTNAEEAVQILAGAGIPNVIPATDLADGANKAVNAALGRM